MICPNCSQTIGNYAVVCRHCGRLLNVSAPVTSDPAAAAVEGAAQAAPIASVVAPIADASARKTKIKRDFLWVVVCYVLAAVLLCAAVAATVFALRDSGELDDILEDVTGEISMLGAEPVSSEGFADADTLVAAYVAAFEQSDANEISSMFAPGMLEAYYLNGISLVSEWDGWYENYGTTLGEYTITETKALPASEYDGLDEQLGVTFEQLVDVSVAFPEVQMDNGETLVMDFDLAMIDGAWYLIQVW